MDWAGLPWNKAVVVVVRGWGASDAKKKKKRPYLEQYLISIGCRCWGLGIYGDVVGGGVNQLQPTCMWP